MLKKLTNIFKTFKILLVIGFLVYFCKIYSQNLLHIINGSTYIIVALLLCFFKYLESLFYCLDTKDNSKMKNSLKFYFIIYILLLIFTLIFDRHMSFSFLFNYKNWFSHIGSSNFIPFVSTIQMVKSIFVRGNYEALSLILGNIILLIPLAYFLPRLFEKTKRIRYFTLTIILFTLVIEFLQLLSDSGCFDIDDIILNSAGVLLLFYPFNKSFFAKVLDKVFLLSNEKISKKEIIISCCIILGICLLFFIAIYNYYIVDSAISIEIICKNDSCNGEKVLFYEDDNYYYYVKEECIKSLYIKLNKDEYLLKEFLSGKGKKKYHNVFSLENNYDWSNIKEYVERKSKYFESFVSYPSREIKIEYEYDNSFVEIETFNTEISSENNLINYYRIKPKQTGKIVVKCLIKSIYDYEIIEVLDLNFYIDEELNVQEK